MSTQPLWLKHRRLAEDQAHQLARIALETDGDEVFKRPIRDRGR